MTCAPSDYMCIIENCSGKAGTGGLLFDYWINNDCPSAYAQGMNTLSNGMLGYNPTAQLVMQGQVSKLFDTYFVTNSITDDVTSSSYNSFQRTLLELCLNPTLPGICDAALTSYCSPFNRDQVLNSPIKTDFCGCYVPPDPVYLSYTLGSPGCLVGTGCTAGCKATDPGCTGQPACDPLCHRALTVQKAYQPTGNVISCPQSICVIADAIVNVDSTTIPGGINFNNYCSGCNNGSGCLCVVSGTNISLTAAQVGLGVNFNQFCGPGSICLLENNGETVIQDCNTINPADIPVTVPFYAPNPAIIILIVITVLIVFFACLAASGDVMGSR